MERLYAWMGWTDTNKQKVPDITTASPTPLTPPPEEDSNETWVHISSPRTLTITPATPSLDAPPPMTAQPTTLTPHHEEEPAASQPPKQHVVLFHSDTPKNLENTSDSVTIHTNETPLEDALKVPANIIMDPEEKTHTITFHLDATSKSEETPEQKPREDKKNLNPLNIIIPEEKRTPSAPIEIKPLATQSKAQRREQKRQLANTAKECQRNTHAFFKSKHISTHLTHTIQQPSSKKAKRR